MNFKEILKTFFQSEKIHEYSLEPIQKACEYFDHPEKSFESIHIAGTNGKGSVSKMVFQILKDQGEKVGVYTSPHLVDICERFETDAWHMTHEQFSHYATMTLEYGGNLSYFERCVLVAFLFFRDQWCRYAVIEVGLGWRLDATNIITPIITAITNISFDHMEYLGETLESIAREKWWIIKPWIPLVLCHANETLEWIAREQGARVILTLRRDIETNLHGEHQQENAAIAYEIGKLLHIREASLRTSLFHVEHHGRLEYIRENVVLDWAHNEAGLTSLAKYLEEQEMRWEWLHYFIALKSGKSIDLFRHAFPTVKHWGIIDQRNPLLIAPYLLEKARQKGGCSTERKTPVEILEYARWFPRELFVICGSLYVLGEFLGQ